MTTDLAEAKLPVMQRQAKPPNALAELFKDRVIPPALAAALVQAQIAAKGVKKDGRNKHSGYDYTTADTMVDAAKVALNGAGLAVMPLGLDVTMFTAGPKQVLNYDLIREIVLVHESGASIGFEVKWPLYLQSGKRARDKAVGAADTTMMGYIYRDLCAIPRGLDAGSVDDRDDAGSQEPGQAATPPKASKPAAKPKPPAKPKDNAKAKAAEEKAAKAKTAKEKAAKAKVAKVKAAKAKVAAAKKAAAEAEAEAAAAEDAAYDGAAPGECENEADPTVEPTPEDAAEGELAKPGKTSIGQVYGDEQKDKASAEQFAELTEEQQDEQIALALRQGLTPSTAEGKLLPQLIEMLPADPGADDLEARGWDKAIAEEMSDLDDAAPVARKTVNAVTRLATTKLGLKTKEAVARFTAAFSHMGVDVAGKQPPNGYQLRCFAMAVVESNGAEAE